MALPFLSSASKRGEQIIAIDLGGRTTKAVVLQHKAGKWTLLSYALVDAPIYEKSLSPELLTEHLRGVVQALDTKTRHVALAVGVNDALVRHADLPQIPISDMRQVLKNNPKNYLQQDLPGHLYDCYVIPPRPGKAPEKGKVPSGPPKARVLVAAAKKQFVDDLQNGARSAGLIPESISPGLLGPINAFELSLPEVFSREIVALVDVGFKSTSVCILQEGELILSRVVGIGGDKITAGLADALGISYAEAEGIKVGMPAEVQPNLETLVLPLGRELRASLDFFEHQNDKAVSQVFITGATARSELLVQMLQTELMTECKQWNPLSFVQFALPPAQSGEVDNAATQLAVAIGAGVASF
jgi:type IV pilus assembly protein PilM